MSERVPVAIAVVSSVVILVYACATTPTTNPSPSPSAAVQSGAPANQPPGGQFPGGRAGGQGGQRVPLTDSARRVRDSVTAARRDSGAASVLRSIAGRENQPAESVFKNIKILRQVPAGRLVRIMNVGFGRSLGARCRLCHVQDHWDAEDKEEKKTARLMITMVDSVNTRFLSQIKHRDGTSAFTNCGMCHRGHSHPQPF